MGFFRQPTPRRFHHPYIYAAVLLLMAVFYYLVFVRA